jgi:hypothetical protein
MGHPGGTRGPDPLTQAAVTDEELAHVYGVLERFSETYQGRAGERAQHRRIILFPAYGAETSGASSAPRRSFFQELEH